MLLRRIQGTCRFKALQVISQAQKEAGGVSKAPTVLYIIPAASGSFTAAQPIYPFDALHSVALPQST